MDNFINELLEKTREAIASDWRCGTLRNLELIQYESNNEFSPRITHLMRGIISGPFDKQATKYFTAGVHESSLDADKVQEHVSDIVLELGNIWRVSFCNGKGRYLA